MEITGTVIAILPERSGTSAKGEWHSQSYVIETQDQYPKHLCFDVFGADKIAQFAIKQGEVITVCFDIDARLYQDRWYNSVKAWKVVHSGQQTVQQPMQTQPPQQLQQANIFNGQQQTQGDVYDPPF